MNNKFNLLVINPGSTSTKVALYENEKELFKESLEHNSEELSKYAKIADQYEMRRNSIQLFLNKIGFDSKDISAIVARGGILPPVKSGAYKVNQLMVDRLRTKPIVEHASNLGAIIAFDMANDLGIDAYIYDSVAVDELQDIARISGLPEFPRRSLTHALNMRAVAIKTAKKLNKDYWDCKFIIAHLGGGISLSAHRYGEMIDVVTDDEGPFSPERGGRIATKPLIKVCYSGKYDQKTMLNKFRGAGGLSAYLNTNKALEVEKRISNGDKDAELIYSAMAYQISKCIGELATVLKGEVDRIIITGGIAHSDMITNWIKERVDFIAPIEIVPGENELEALALGALRVLRKEEKPYEYIE